MKVSKNDINEVYLEGCIKRYEKTFCQIEKLRQKAKIELAKYDYILENMGSKLIKMYDVLSDIYFNSWIKDIYKECKFNRFKNKMTVKNGKDIFVEFCMISDEVYNENINFVFDCIKELSTLRDVKRCICIEKSLNKFESMLKKFYNNDKHILETYRTINKNKELKDVEQEL